MNLGTILKTSLIVTLVAMVAGAIFKILHFQGGENFMTIGLIASLVFAILAIYEVWSAGKIDKNEKVMWTIGFVFLTSIVGIIYLLSARKRILLIQRPHIS